MSVLRSLADAVSLVFLTLVLGIGLVVAKVLDWWDRR